MSKRVTIIIAVVALLSCLLPALSANTNVIIIPEGEKRAGAVFFVDECLTRGLTNSISLVELRKWATNTIQLYKRKDNAGANFTSERNSRVRARDVPDRINQIQTRIPSCRHAKSSKELQALEGYREMISIYAKRWGVTTEEADKRLRTLGPNKESPRVLLVRSEEGVIKAVSIQWYLYGIIIGPDSYRHDGKPWYKRKLADGVYLWHGHK